MNTNINRGLAAAVLATGIILTMTGCEDSGVNAPSDGNLVLTPAVANIVIPEGANEGSFTFTAALYSPTGNPLKGVNIRFVTSAGSWNQEVVTTDDIGEARATLTLQTSDPAEVDVQARSSSLFADATAFKTVQANDPPRAAIIDVPLGEQQVGSVVTFDGSASLDSDGSITCYQWTIDSDFDPDDEIVQGVGASGLQRTYNAEQFMSVVLRVSDSPAVGAVCNDPAVIGIDLFSPLLAAITYTITCENTPPTAVAGNDVTTTISGTEVSVILDGRGSFDTDGTIDEYRWDCGNGRPAQPTGVPGLVNCRYTSENAYIAELTVYDDGTDGVTIDPRTGDLLCKKSATDTLVVTVSRP